MRRAGLLFVGCCLVAAGVAAATGGNHLPVAAQDDGFPTVGPFATVNPDPWPTVGPFQTAGPQETAGPVATVAPSPTPVPEPGTIRVVGAAGAEAGDDRVSLAADVAVELILDNSGSMLQPLGDELRIDVAKRVLTDLVEDSLPPGTPLALRVFGDEPESCETDLAVPLQPLEPAAMTERIAEIQSVNLVRTPIGAALESVASDLAAAEGPKLVVLVTDGEETCGGNPTRAIRRLIAGGIDVRVNIVGFALDDEALAEQFADWARLGGGQYVEATDAETLGAAIRQALQPPFTVRDADAEVVARGVVGGEPLAVPAGTYTVVVESDPRQEIEDVVVAAGEDVTLRLGEA